MILPLHLTVAQGLAMAAAVVVAAFVRGYSGFGFSALTIAFAALIADPRAVMPVVFFCELGMTLLQARGVLRLIDWGRVLAMLAGAVVVMPFSVAFLAQVGLDTARLAISSVILLMCGVLLTGWTLRQRIGGPGHFGVGMISGLCNGAAVGGLPVAAFLSAQPVAAPVFRATMIAYLTTIDIVALPLFAHAGLVTHDTLVAALLSVPLLIAGLTLGGRHFLAASPQGFRRMAIGLLAVLSLLGLLKSVM
jgi:uncharacterized protein